MTKKSSEKKKKTSPDYSLIVRKIIEGSGDATISKLAAGLYIVATPIGHLGDISLRALVTLASADRIACEDTRMTGLLLARYGLKKTLLSYHDHSADEKQLAILKHIAAGEAVALVSDAGMPLIADPGYKLVRQCREQGYDVTVVPGANAALTALSGSGLPTDRFLFVGFLPPKKTARLKALAEVQSIVATQIFYEAPQRLAESLEDMASLLGASRPAVVARELTKLYEETRRGSLGELALYYKENPPKGEIVILLSPPENNEASQQDIDALLTEQLQTYSLRDAVAVVATITGLKKGDVYKRALALTS